jgi:predicted thioesterase
VPLETITVGLRGNAEIEVQDPSCTQRGDYKIFSTPNMVLLLERAAIEALAPHLDSNKVSVGTRVDVQHLAPTLKGMRARAEATVREVEGSRVLFDVDVFDDLEKVGSAVHERFILDLDRYVRRLEKKVAAFAVNPDSGGTAAR